MTLGFWWKSSNLPPEKPSIFLWLIRYNNKLSYSLPFRKGFFNIRFLLFAMFLCTPGVFKLKFIVDCWLLMIRSILPPIFPGNAPFLPLFSPGNAPYFPGNALFKNVASMLIWDFSRHILPKRALFVALNWKELQLA